MDNNANRGQRIIFVLLLLTLLSCRGKQSIILPKDSKKISPLLISGEREELTDIIIQTELIPVRESRKYFTGCSQMLIGRNNIYILSGGAVFSFSSNGEGLMSIGKIGRGPGEYLRIRHICFSNDENEIWCLDTYLNRVYRYSTSDGSFIGMLDPRILGQSVDAILPVFEDKIAFYIPNPPNVGHNKQAFECLRIYDMNGAAVSDALPWRGFSIVSGFTRPVSVSYGKIIALSIGLYPGYLMFEKGRLYKYVKLDFGDKNPSLDLSDSSSPWSGIKELFEEDSYKLLSSVYYVGDAVYFTVYGKKSSLWNFLINRVATKGIRWQSGYVGGPPTGALAADDNYLYYYFDDLRPTSSHLRPDPLVVYLQQKFGGMIEPDVSYVVKVQYEIQ